MWGLFSSISEIKTYSRKFGFCFSSRVADNLLRFWLLNLTPLFDFWITASMRGGLPCQILSELMFLWRQSLELSLPACSWDFYVSYSRKAGCIRFCIWLLSTLIGTLYFCRGPVICFPTGWEACVDPQLHPCPMQELFQHTPQEYSMAPVWLRVFESHLESINYYKRYWWWWDPRMKKP